VQVPEVLTERQVVSKAMLPRLIDSLYVTTTMDTLRKATAHLWRMAIIQQVVTTTAILTNALPLKALRLILIPMRQR